MITSGGGRYVSSFIERPMTTREKRRPKQISIQTGEFHVSRERVIISTLLGSCISACLYDPVKNVVGMNHFLLSNNKYSQNMPVCTTEAGRYGIHAMELVINGMFKLGAEHSNLKAKVFGGSSFFSTPDEADNFFCIGEVNCRFIRDFLKDRGIPLIANDLGGDRGRIVHFSSVDFSVMVRKIPKTRSPKILDMEKRFWRQSIEDRRRAVDEMNVWT
jgi:chemotaxis protein CheD